MSFGASSRPATVSFVSHGPRDGSATLPYDSFPDLGALSDEELKQLIQRHTEEEQEVSYRRRILHGKIDILRAELVNRLRKKHQEGESVITGADVQQLTDILAGKSAPEPDAE